MELRFGWGLPALLVLLSLSCISKAQDSTAIDSLFRLADDPQRLPESSLLLLTDQLDTYPNPLDRARIHARTSTLYFEMGQLDSAAANALSVLTLAPGNTALCSTANLSLGLVAYQKSALERASNFLGKSLRLFELLDNKNGQLVVWNYLARIAERQNRLPEALRDYKQSLAIAQDIRDSLRVSSLRLELAVLYRKLRRFTEAQAFLNEGLRDARQRRDSIQMSEVLVELGMVAEDQAVYLTALDYYAQALILDRKWGSRFSGYTNVSRMYGSMGKLDTASRYADSAEVAAVESGRVLDLRSCFQWRYTLSERMSDTAKALVYYKRYVQYDDSVKREEADQRVRNVHDDLILGTNEASIRTADLEQKLANVRGERDQQWRNFLFLMSGSLVLFVLVLFFWLKTRSQAEKRIQEKEEKIAELAILKEKLFTVVAHDLQAPVSAFNTLTHSLAEANKLTVEDTKSHLHKLIISGRELSLALNQSLEWTIAQSGTMPFHRELVNCRQVADEVERQLHALAQEKRLEVAFLIPDALHAFGDRAMIAIILRTLLYNAIRFSPEGRTVTLFSGRRDDLITLGVKDNGAGIPTDRLTRIFDWSNDTVGVIGRGRVGIGLPMCKELVSRNGGNLYVESELKLGSTFYFTLPEHGSTT